MTDWLLTNELTYSLEQSTTWQASRSLDSQKTSHTLWNLEIQEATIQIRTLSGALILRPKERNNTLVNFDARDDSLLL